MSFKSYDRPSGVLQNKFNSDDLEDISARERELSSKRFSEIVLGLGPKGNFDRNHLKAIHHHLFQDIYPWAGHMRDESFTVDGHHYGVVAGMRKGHSSFLDTHFFLHGLNDAFKPVGQLRSLNAVSIEQFADLAGEALGRLNYVHPFREGNGRTQRAFIVMLAQEKGLEPDFSKVTYGTNINASVAVQTDPESLALKSLLLDALDPDRQHLIETAMKMLRGEGIDPEPYTIRTAMVGETVEGNVSVMGERACGLMRDGEVVIVANEDLPDRPHGLVRVTANTSLSQKSAG